MTKLIDSDWLTAVQFFFVNSEERLSYFRAKTFFFFKKLKLHSPYGLMQFNTFEKPTSANYFQIEREKSYDYLFTFFNKHASFWSALHHSICFCFAFYQKLTLYKPQNLEKIRLCHDRTWRCVGLLHVIYYFTNFFVYMFTTTKCHADKFVASCQK